MRLRSPSSRGFFRARLAPFDMLWAAISPILALYLTNAQILYGPYNPGDLVIFWFLALAFALIAFIGFRLRDGVTQYFSVNDALDILKAVVIAEFFTGATLFFLTRLEGVPRSAPIVHALVLAAGLVLFRLLMRMTHSDTKRPRRNRNAVVERILMVGATKLAVQYIQLLDALTSQKRQVVALLDDREGWVGRTIVGVSVAGPTHQIKETLDEYSIHGVRIDRVIVGGDADSLSQEALYELERVCADYGIPLEFVPNLIGLSALKVDEAETQAPVLPTIELPVYFRSKRLLDILVSLALIILLSPFLVVACVLGLLDVGSPIFFWQQRLGQGGQSFLLYKLRTLRPPFDGQGEAIPEASRLSWIGALLRRFRIDEFPQLLNVLVGDMSLIGPRPLLPEDQPEDPAIRLMVRPGITGWAQVNGGVALTPAEKQRLDEWYVCNASLGLDLLIMLMTTRFVFAGEHKSVKQPDEQEQQQQQSRVIVSAPGPKTDDGEATCVMRPEPASSPRPLRPPPARKSA